LPRSGSVATSDDRFGNHVAVRKAALVFFVLLPWLLYFGLVFTAWWFIIFDGRSSTDQLGWILLGLALPALFVAARVSRWERAWIRAHFSAEMWTRGPGRVGGSFLDLFWP
jgi:hypothetical protein